MWKKKSLLFHPRRQPAVRLAPAERRGAWEVREESSPAPGCALAVRLGRRENWQSRREACAKTAFPKCWAKEPCRRIGPEGLKAARKNNKSTAFRPPQGGAVGAMSPAPARGRKRKRGGLERRGHEPPFWKGFREPFWGGFGEKKAFTSNLLS